MLNIFSRPGGGALLAMEFLTLSSCTQQAALGSQLAKLHLHNKNLQVLSQKYFLLYNRLVNLFVPGHRGLCGPLWFWLWDLLWISASEESVERRLGWFLHWKVRGTDTKAARRGAENIVGQTEAKYSKAFLWHWGLPLPATWRPLGRQCGPSWEWPCDIWPSLLLWASWVRPRHRCHVWGIHIRILFCLPQAHP